MQKLATYKGLTVSLNDEKQIVVSGKYQKKCSTKMTRDSKEWEMMVEIVCDNTPLVEVIMDVMVAKAVVAVQSAFRNLKSQQVVDKLLEALPKQNKVPMYSVAIEDAGKSPVAKDSSAALKARIASKSKEEQKEILRASLIEQGISEEAVDALLATAK